MAQVLFEIKFTGTKEVLQVAERRQKLLGQNIRNAVARTVLWGATRIAEDCSVDTGRLRSSILGYLAAQYSIELEGSDQQAIMEGLGGSTTHVNGLEGRIGTNTKYALLVDLGISGRNNKPLSSKQLRYLFYKGILKRVKGSKQVIYTYKRKGSRGKGFFRKNIPLIDRYFHAQMEEAVKATKEDRPLPVTF
jgi:hypothetical protein